VLDMVRARAHYGSRKAAPTTGILAAPAITPVRIPSASAYVERSLYARGVHAPMVGTRFWSR